MRHPAEPFVGGRDFMISLHAKQMSLEQVYGVVITVYTIPQQKTKIEEIKKKRSTFEK